MRTDDVHRREPDSTGPVILKSSKLDDLVLPIQVIPGTNYTVLRRGKKRVRIN